jgi:RNA polymerase, sigma subunit, ECF family
MQDRLLALVYTQLKQLANQQMRHERPNHTLSPTALVHESFLRLFNQHSINWQSKKHFYGAVAESMRRILVESARAKKPLNAVVANRIFLILISPMRQRAIMTWWP